MTQMAAFGKRLIDSGQRLIDDHVDLSPTGYPTADFLYGNFIDRPARLTGRAIVAIGTIAMVASNDK